MPIPPSYSGAFNTITNVPLLTKPLIIRWLKKKKSATFQAKYLGDDRIESLTKRL